MLAEISIENLGVIPRATAELSQGLTVLTGETGAGKTMVVTGLRLLCGGRADAGRVRVGTKQAVVEGRFQVSDCEDSVREGVEAIAEATGASTDENGEYIASRIVSASGRSRAHLGGRSVPAASLKDFSAELLTIHGQNDQLRLLSPDRQIEALDRMDPGIEPLLASYREDYRSWRRLAKELQEKTKSRRELAQEADRLDFAINEILAVSPVEGEDEELQARIRRLQDVDELREAAVVALQALDGTGSLDAYSAGPEDESASTLLGQASDALAHTEDEELKAMSASLREAIETVAEVSSSLGRFLTDLPADPEELESSLQRQQELKGLTRKYAPDLAGVLEWLKKAEKKRALIDTSPEAIEKLKKDTAVAEKKVLAGAKKLSQARQAAAKKLGQLVTEELHGLSMPKAVLSVQVSEAPLSSSGGDEVVFLLAPNSGTQPRPLASSASGGELSRVMLALEVILSAGSRGTTLVFDEVDAGVGGRAAVEIGRRLARLAQHNQVIVVTHLPQVAAFADTHLHVSKDVGEDSVTSGVETLSRERRVEELARMLAGLDNTETGRAHATELLDTAAEEVAAMREV